MAVKKKKVINISVFATNYQSMTAFSIKKGQIEDSEEGFPLFWT